MSWLSKPIDENRVEFLLENFDLTRVTAMLLSRMEMEEIRDIKRFLNPRLSQLQSPFSIPNVEEAVERLSVAVREKQKIFVLGDYDVDGVTSISLFVGIMRELGLDPYYAVPKRTDDGYGLSLEVVKEKVISEDNDFSLVVALDCGSNDETEIRNIRDCGVDVVVVDHHQIRDGISPDAIVVNPHSTEAESDDAKIHCTVALTYKLMQGLLQRLRSQRIARSDQVSIKDYLDFVALGTLTDLVPLVGDNRIMVKHGLSRIGKSRHFGLQALMDVCSLPYGKEMDVSDVSFKLGPRINAGGRMADAMLSVELLLSKSFSSCIKYADELDMLNQNRQSTERSIYDQAISYLSRKAPRDAVVLYNPEWHTGVVGIVSSRIARHCGVPVVVLGSDGTYARGSARSVEGINIVEALNSCGEYLEGWGGHPMAAGLSIKPENIENFREALNKAVSRQCRREESSFGCQENVQVDAWIEAKDITYDFMTQLSSLGPFGVSNPEPVIGLRKAQLASKVSRFGTDNFKFWVNLVGTDFDLMCLGWNFPARVPESRQPLDLIFHLKWHEWKGRGYPQATIIDWRYSSSG